MAGIIDIMPIITDGIMAAVFIMQLARDIVYPYIPQTPNRVKGVFPIRPLDAYTVCVLLWRLRYEIALYIRK